MAGLEVLPVRVSRMGLRAHGPCLFGAAGGARVLKNDGANFWRLPLRRARRGNDPARGQPDELARWTNPGPKHQVFEGLVSAFLREVTSR